MHYCAALFLCWVFSKPLHGQYGNIDTLRGVEVVALKDTAAVLSLNLHRVELGQSAARRYATITDALADVPGVDQLSTGPGVSKPVIRGLHGSRMLVLIDGLKLENQQWQDEHGLGMGMMGFEAARVLKSPMSVIYGSEALGGVIDLLPQGTGDGGMREISVQTRVSTFNGGVITSAGLKTGRGRWRWNIFASTETTADYADGNNSRVLNSRYGQQTLLVGAKRRGDRWVNQLNYHLFSGKYGFIFSDLGQFFEPDERWNRSMNGPYHQVQLHLLTLKNRLKLSRGRVSVDGNIASNYRAENEGGSRFSLQMLALSTAQSTRWEYKVDSSTTVIIANNFYAMKNVNYGFRKLIPDATVIESTPSVYVRSNLGHFFMVEGAISAGSRYIQSFPTSGLNTESGSVQPFAQNRPYANAMSGVCINPESGFKLGLNASTGVRSPNLLELSANGLHEGVYTFEKGDPNLFNERGLSFSSYASYEQKRVRVVGELFTHRFTNYIYLEPTGDTWYGFPIWQFTQQAATITGGELTAQMPTDIFQQGETTLKFAALEGKLSNDEYLPYMPAWKASIKQQVTLLHPVGRLIVKAHAEFSQVFPRTNTAVGETATDGYRLVNAGLSATRNGTKAMYNLSLSGTNLLNTVYIDHMSRLKEFGTYSMGRNILLTLQITLLHKQNKP